MYSSGFIPSAAISSGEKGAEEIVDIEPMKGLTGLIVSIFSYYFCSRFATLYTDGAELKFWLRAKVSFNWLKCWDIKGSSYLFEASGGKNTPSKVRDSSLISFEENS